MSPTDQDMTGPESSESKIFINMRLYGRNSKTYVETAESISWVGKQPTMGWGI